MSSYVKYIMGGSSAVLIPLLKIVLSKIIQKYNEEKDNESDEVYEAYPVARRTSEETAKYTDI